MNIPKIYQFGIYQIYHYNEIKSTNDHAWNLISNNNPKENVVIVADNQTHGKGQYGRKWESSIGKNITMTAIVAPKSLEIKNAFYLNIIVSLAICTVLEDHLKIKLKIKWPNDIYYKNRKLCGILIKNKIVNNQIKNSIIGMGINVNQNKFNQILLNPTSMTLISNNVFDKKILISEILMNLQYLFEKVLEFGVSASCEDYNDRLYRKNMSAYFRVNKEEKELSIIRVTETGLIQLKDASGALIELSSGLEYIL